MLKHKNIILGVSGGIAAYKACAITSKLTQAGANVQVIMTKSACEFVAPLTFQAISRNPVHTDTFEENIPEKIAHIDIADWADLCIIAPASANILAKMAHGIADDMLTTTMLATKAEIYIAPAMNVNMYNHPAVKRNMQILHDDGFHFIEPGAGYLACGWVGKGRLEEPENIITVIEQHQQVNQTLHGKRVLISAGPTREKIDPVRFFTNRSSGKMGFSLAQAAAEMGAEITLVTGPVHLEIKHPRVKRIDVVTAEEMNQAMQREFMNHDIVIKSAAVADYRPVVTYDDKMKKKPGNLQIEMERTTDILQELAAMKGHQFLVGFAAETTDPIAYGKQKLKKKHLDAIVINNISEEGAGFENDTNTVTYVNKSLEQSVIPLASKSDVARQILFMIDHDMKDELH